jgi:hypothetical protein
MSMVWFGTVVRTLTTPTPFLEKPRRLLHTGPSLRAMRTSSWFPDTKSKRRTMFCGEQQKLGFLFCLDTTRGFARSRATEAKSVPTHTCPISILTTLTLNPSKNTPLSINGLLLLRLQLPISTQQVPSDIMALATWDSNCIGKAVRRG